MTDTERAYLAGFFDGEGSIGIYYYGPKSVNRQVGITNTNREILAELHAQFGGTFYQSAKGDNKPIHRWSVNSKKDIEAFLSRIAPYLREKQEQAEIALREVRGELATMDAIEMLRSRKKGRIPVGSL